MSGTPGADPIEHRNARESFSDASGPAGAALRAHRITAGYGREGGPRRGWADRPSRPGGLVVLRDVSLDVPAGAVTGLGGPSGAGKTTLARVLTGLLVPRQGRVTVDGAPLPTRRGRMSSDVLMLFQSPRRSCDPRRTLRQIVAEPLAIRAPGVRRSAEAEWERVREVGARVGLTDELLERLPAEVSLGQLQRAALARVLLARPRYLVCDEATAMLDAATTASVVGVLREEVARGMGVLAISHDAELLRVWADTVHDIRDLAEPSR